MPQFYKRKTARASRTSIEGLHTAAEKVKSGSALRQAASEHGLDKMTLLRFINKSKNDGPDAIMGYSAVSTAHSVFTEEMEKDLASHISTLADQYHGLSLDKCKELAYEFAVHNKITVPDNWLLKKKQEKDGGWVSRADETWHSVHPKQHRLEEHQHLISTMLIFTLTI